MQKNFFSKGWGVVRNTLGVIFSFINRFSSLFFRHFLGLKKYDLVYLQLGTTVGPKVARWQTGGIVHRGLEL